MSITELKALAEKATPGPWEWDGNASSYDPENEAPWLLQSPWRDINSKVVLQGTIKANQKEDAAYIAAANPAAILELIAQLEDAQGEIRALRATEAGLLERVNELGSVLSQARDALAGGLWDYGPGQDEHEKCNEVIAFVDAALLEKQQ